MKKLKPAVLIHLLAWFIALMWILPFLGVFMTSIRPLNEILHGWWNFESFNPTLYNYVEAWADPMFPLWRGELNSLIVAIPATILPLFIGALSAYAFTRFSFALKNYLFLILVLLMAMPLQSVIIPLFIMMNDWGLINNYLSLIVIHSAWGLPWILLFMRNYFSTLPVETEEAARVDGASDFKVFLKIVIPISLPALISVMVLQFLWVWNDFFLALTLVYEPDMYLATQCVPRIGMGQYHQNWGVLSAGSIIVMIIPILLFAFLQKYYVKGLTGWALKG
jgi:multiple sugar transport system permease protein